MTRACTGTWPRRRVFHGCHDRLAEDDLGLLRQRFDRLQAQLLLPGPA